MELKDFARPSHLWDRPPNGYGHIGTCEECGQYKIVICLPIIKRVKIYVKDPHTLAELKPHSAFLCWWCHTVFLEREYNK